MKNCLDTGKIQAFLDGELSLSEAGEVSAHIAACDACAAQLTTAEVESAFVFSVLEREMDTLVPTQRLWNKINDSIDVDRHHTHFCKKAWTFIIVSLANPSVVGAAALLVVFLGLAIVLMERNTTVGTDDIARLPQTTAPASTTAFNNNASQDDVREAVVPPLSTGGPAIRAVPATYRAERRTDTGPKRSAVTQPAYIPGEESYVKTITTLSKTVDNQKDTVLRPSERISYERDMAVVDDAIAKMKKEVRRNPKNESAKQVLYTSYQNKIDLLNSVSQREELVAGIRD